MAAKIVENARTAKAQKVTSQADGIGLRIGRRAEISGIFPITPEGARIFRQRQPQFQAEATYWEDRIGTAHEFHIAFQHSNSSGGQLWTLVTRGERYCSFMAC